MYAGVNSLICKPAISIANAVFPIMIRWFGYDSAKKLGEQSAEAVFGIRFSWVFISAALLLLCAVIIGRFYGLHGAEWDGIKRELAVRHAEKQSAFEEEMLGKK